MSGRADTIAAVATAPGAGGVGVLRVSGDRAGEIARAVLGRAPRARHAHYAAFRAADGGVIDRGILLWFPAPHSYTGEDVLELQAHGSPVVLRMLLARLVELGARHARAGEFSERAFLHGRIDLAQAEAVADLIASGSEAAARAAQRSLEGEFSTRVHALAERVVRLRVWIEAAIDFPEEEIDFLKAPELAAEVDATRGDLHALLGETRRGVRLADGLHVVIVGRPNVGKSSLLNALAASERAIVTDVAGTTRDVLRETIDLDGIALTLVDTAGLRDAADVVEREGIRRARGELERADLAVLVSDDGDAARDLDLLRTIPSRAVRVVVHNKIDLAGTRAHREERDGIVHLWLSARSREGLDGLVAELRRHAGAGESDAGAFTARARHVAALERARAHFDAAVAALAERNAGELAAEDLRRAHDALGEITGEVSADDLLGEIFSSFCIGK
ncbi:tRNA uridine-5-carboxymethylaminomethyl(34) synthesis GTPase MnmE [Dokdonella fugitiva]|jgi:tRNA modification GTPase|uniref:tRNA modification GTPase MnmE n=1 Tax=Dokdonella fugitiva TaxID=328517 RepID=A0A4R2IGR8_9GAMM|nr:tRNA uridine-5-carboxymethylaminomethyl(34) synthesis GTPase MnmE [Dokdonella fugitiva]TCO43416.1 tRNA modification GTPase [Dokdonella fugitiva]